LADPLPPSLRDCAERWQLRIDGPLHGGSLSRVYACTTRDGRPTVLKLCPPDAPAEREAAALRLWNGSGAARLLQHDLRAGALLIERILPGTRLPPGIDDAVLSAAAAVLERLHAVAVPVHHAFPSLDRQFDSYLLRARSWVEPGTIGAALLDRSREPAMRLCTTANRAVLVHGDYIDKNLLLGPSGYVAIDPMPGVGDPCADVGMFASYHPPARLIGECARTLAGLLGYDPDRAEQWALIWAIGEATETWRDDSDELQEWVKSRAVPDGDEGYGATRGEL
jgi:streptomycin 6-kinase